MVCPSQEDKVESRDTRSSELRQAKVKDKDVLDVEEAVKPREEAA